MSEHDWHKRTREEVFSNQQPNKAFQSHSSVSKLQLFRVAQGEIVRRIGCLSDADIVVFDSASGHVRKIIEIESALNPKKIIGIVIATHLCNICRIKENDYVLENVCLEIVFKKAPPGSKKDLKLEIFGPLINDLIKSMKGCLSTPLIYSPHE